MSKRPTAQLGTGMPGLGTGRRNLYRNCRRRLAREARLQDTASARDEAMAGQAHQGERAHRPTHARGTASRCPCPARRTSAGARLPARQHESRRRRIASMVTAQARAAAGGGRIEFDAGRGSSMKGLWRDSVAATLCVVAAGALVELGPLAVRGLNGTVHVEGETTSGAEGIGRAVLYEITGAADRLRLTVRDTRWQTGERDVVACERYDSPRGSTRSSVACGSRSRITASPTSSCARRGCARMVAPGCLFLTSASSTAARGSTCAQRCSRTARAR